MSRVPSILLSLLVAAGGVAAAAGVGTPGATAATVASSTGGTIGLGKVPFTPPASPAAAMLRSYAAVGSHLAYYGGPVVANPDIVQVLYVAGSYLPELTDTTPGVANTSNFLAGIVASTFVTGLDEYNTVGLTGITGHPGTN